MNYSYLVVGYGIEGVSLIFLSGFEVGCIVVCSRLFVWWMFFSFFMFFDCG